MHFLGEEADRGSDDDEESRHKRWSARALHSVPLTYNYNQHVIAGELGAADLRGATYFIQRGYELSWYQGRL